MPLVLASASAIRTTMLRKARIAHEVVPAAIDEGSIKGAEETDAPLRLAEAKALAVSSARPGDWVIGSDSMVAVEGRRFDKPRDRDEALAHLRFFSGKPMALTSAVALARSGRIEWSLADTAVLRWRVLSDAFIESYLDKEWPAVAACVGVFRFEGLGVQLFDSIAGSHFTVLGMPLMPLLRALRERGVIAS